MKKLFKVQVVVSGEQYPINYQFLSGIEAREFAAKAETLAGVKAVTEPDWPTAIYDGKSAAADAFNSLLGFVR